MIPASAVSSLALNKQGEIPARGAFGKREMVGLYVVDLQFLGLAFPNYPVTESRDIDFALVGRDILNRYVTTLDGPRLEFSIE
jgi:hypothetical protein